MFFRVQICDFVDDKNYKKKEINYLSNNLAINLIQTEKTVDLSCKPKQRIKSNSNKSHGEASALLTIDLENNEFKKINQSVCTATYSKSHSKSKNKIQKKKHRLDESFNEDTVSDILDMSVNKVQKTSHHNCFLPTKDCESNQYIMNTNLNCDGVHELSKKLKKRKIQPELLSEEFIVSNYIKSLTSNECVPKKKKKKSKENSLGNKDLSQEISHVQDMSCNSEDVFEIHHKRENSLNCSINNSKTHQTRKDSKNLQTETNESQQIQNDCSLNVELKNYNQAESLCDLQKCLSETKRLYQNHIDTLLANKKHCSSTSVLFENGDESENWNYDVSVDKSKDLHSSSFNNNVVSQNMEEISQSGEQSLQSHLESSTPNPRLRRKRVRKRRKNKKSEYLEAVGPILQNLAAQDEVYKPPTTSTNAKHIYFGDECCTDKTMVDTPSTVPSSLETSKQGKYLNDL